jgi:hypothetical protein
MVSNKIAHMDEPPNRFRINGNKNQKLTEPVVLQNQTAATSVKGNS